MRIEDGVFGSMALLSCSHDINTTLPLNNETFIATANDVSQQAFDKNGNRVTDYKPSELTVLNINGQPAKAGDTCYKWPAMVGRAVKIYTGDSQGEITIRPLEGGEDITITIYPGMMLPIPCKGVGFTAQSNVNSLLMLV